MDKQKVTRLPRQLVLPLLLVSIFNPWLVETTSAQQLDVRHLEQSYNVKTNRGSRIKEPEHRRCKPCEEKETKAKLEYLERVLTEQGSANYQNEIEAIIFTDKKFVNGCWKKANKKGMEIFFTINNSGIVNDFAWFPKYRAGKCIERHISKIEFPDPGKPHHAWLVTPQLTR